MTRTNGNLCGFYVFVESEELKAKQGQKARKCTHTNTHTHNRHRSVYYLISQTKQITNWEKEREKKKKKKNKQQSGKSVA